MTFCTVVKPYKRAIVKIWKPLTELNNLAHSAPLLPSKALITFQVCIFGTNFLSDLNKQGLQILSLY